MYGTGILKGMALTFKHIFREPFTVQYPEERLPTSPRYRGIEFLWSQERCTGCDTCAKACPEGVITVVTHRGEQGQRIVDRYEIDLRICLYCGLCVEACPFHAIMMGKVYEMAQYDVQKLYLDKEYFLTHFREWM
jgi:NADH-quinone oxidoreductase chain I